MGVNTMPTQRVGEKIWTIVVAAGSGTRFGGAEGGAEVASVGRGGVGADSSAA